MLIRGFGNNYIYNKPIRVEEEPKTQPTKNDDLKVVINKDPNIIEPAEDENVLVMQANTLSNEAKAELLLRRMRQAILQGRGEEWAHLMNPNFVQKGKTWDGLLPGAEVQNPPGLAR